MSSTDKLMFFNKEGYPYNFTLNDGIWTGKLFFDPNGTDTFKSESVYILEQVEPFSYTEDMDIINSELYNDSGMTVSPFTYADVHVEDIKTVNESDRFYTKWVIGDRIDKKFPLHTVVSFSGATTSSATGATDFDSSYLFTVMQTKKNAIMIATSTDNASFNFVYDEATDNFTLSSHRTISFPEFERDLRSTYSPEYDMKMSLVGTEYNDSVYELQYTGTSYTNIYDYELSGLTTGDNFQVDLELLTERPLLYTGTLDISPSGSTLLATFVDGLTTTVSPGDSFIVEDQDGNHLYDGNEYEIDYFVKNLYLGTFNVILSARTYIDDDSKTFEFYELIYDKNDFTLNEGNDILIYHWNYPYNVATSGGTNKTKNSDITRRVVSIHPHETMTNASGETLYVAQLNKTVYYDEDNYKIYHILKDFEQNIAAVTPSISSAATGTTHDVRCMSTTNILHYYQEIVDGGVEDSIDAFVNKYYGGLLSNGVDAYRVNTSLVLEGVYFGQERFFSSSLLVNGLTGETSSDTFSDASGTTSVYNFVVKEGDMKYERYNMSDDLSIPFYADVVLDLFDDVQDYGFRVTVNDVDTYIEFNDNSGTTSYTAETIRSFIDKWETVYQKNGLLLWSGTTSGSTTGETLNHLYIQGVEPNVDVYSFDVNVNKNSTKDIVSLIYNRRILLTSNYLYSSSLDFTTMGFTTGMIIAISGSTYPPNNKEYNIIGLFPDKIELSYQGPMYTETGITLHIETRTHLRRPRESNTKDIYYRFRWTDDLSNDIFLYDLSGENLEPWGGDENLRYVGPLPLTKNNDVVILNRQPNRDRKYVTTPYKQQTVFDELSFKLERFDDDNASVLPKPINFFLGYNSKFEGVHRRELIMERVDNVSYDGYADGTSLYFVASGNTLQVVSSDPVDFLDIGFEVGRHVKIRFDDNKPYTQDIFESWQEFLMVEVTKTKIVIDGEFEYFTTQDKEFDFYIEQTPQQMGRFIIVGETESEDERLEANMKLIGVSLTEEDEYIFKQSNIKEEGIDYRLLNRKRKEMMSVYPDIFNFVGSYKAIFNAINFFGYTDLQLFEYYKNINEQSPLYGKLKRVVIPDMLERQVEGWTYSEDLALKADYKKTSLLNLTYRITDEEGNNVNLYSVRDVQVKLNGLKKWLRKWIIPVNTNIRDITGVSENVGIMWRRFDASVNIKSQETIEETVGVNFNYTATRNFNDNWLVSVRFYTVNDFVPEQFDLKVITYTKDDDGLLHPQQYYDVYKTDMLPFNFSLNWVDNSYDKFFSVETQYYNERGMGIKVNKMYRLEDGCTFYYDEYKNYILVNNNFTYRYPTNMQDKENIYIVDEDGNIYVIEKEVPYSNTTV